MNSFLVACFLVTSLLTQLAVAFALMDIRDELRKRNNRPKP